MHDTVTIFKGDYPDPSILKTETGYYLTHSSFDYYPGLVIWHSDDLLNWKPAGPALFENTGSVWAPDLCMHNNVYYIYFAAKKNNSSNVYVIKSDNIDGPWSRPFPLYIDKIDPGHASDENGNRFLFLSGGYIVPLSDDGLKKAGPLKKIYDGWKYPPDWDVESWSQEGPKIIKYEEYYHMILAEGGTAGPPTGHMVISARSKNLNGPWENSPHNPVVRTQNSKEKWWSQGHATVFKGPDNNWYIVYHAYENGYYNLGRQTLLACAEWTDKGWLKVKSIPGLKISTVQQTDFSDDFSKNRMGVQWRFFKSYDEKRYKYINSGLEIECRGSSPADSNPLAFICGEHAYEIEVELNITENAQAGVILFYNEKAYAGFGFNRNNMILHRYGTERFYKAEMPAKLFIKLKNDNHIVTIYYSNDNCNWIKFSIQMEVSGYHHNVFYNFLSLRPALYSAGKGKTVFRNFRFRKI